MTTISKRASADPRVLRADNDVITYMNLIYLGMITERIPIMAPFVPLHIGRDADPLQFGSVFDVPRFIEEAGFPLVEWHQVKDMWSDVWDDLGCWDIWEAVQMGADSPRGSVQPSILRLGELFHRRTI